MDESHDRSDHELRSLLAMSSELALIPVIKLDWLIGKTRIEDLVLGGS